MSMRADIAEILYTEEQLAEIVKNIGRRISEDYKDKNLFMVSVLKGSLIFMADLMRAVDIPCSIDFLSVSSYGTEATSSGVVKIIKDLDADVTGRHILLVEDIIDTGITLAYLRDYLSNRGAKSVKICTLLDKPSRREKAVQVDYIGFTMPDEFIIGYGIDYAENYRNLPYVASLKRSVYEK